MNDEYIEAMSREDLENSHIRALKFIASKKMSVEFILYIEKGEWKMKSIIPIYVNLTNIPTWIVPHIFPDLFGFKTKGNKTYGIIGEQSG